MSKTEKFREQHDELLKIATEISTHLDVDELSNDASEVRKLLSKLLGKLSIHIAVENKSLYPRLLAHSDERVNSLAKKFIDEMGNIGHVIKEYNSSWSSTTEIQKSPSEFIEHTKGLFDALGKRIARENNELYKTIDEL